MSDYMDEKEFERLMADPDLFKTPSIVDVFNDIFRTKPSEKTVQAAFDSANNAFAERLMNLPAPQQQHAVRDSAGGVQWVKP